MSNIETLLAIKEAMATLRVGRTNLYALLKSGQLQAVKVGSRTLIRESELARFIAALPAYKQAAQNDQA
jgi:excisionase family DNA binding protein